MGKHRQSLILASAISRPDAITAWGLAVAANLALPTQSAGAVSNWVSIEPESESMITYTAGRLLLR